VAEICGEVGNEVTARSSITLRKTGKISGTVLYGDLEIETGARVRGTMRQMEDREIAPAPETPASPVSLLPSAEQGSGS